MFRLLSVLAVLTVAAGMLFANSASSAPDPDTPFLAADNLIDESSAASDYDGKYDIHSRTAILTPSLVSLDTIRAAGDDINVGVIALPLKPPPRLS
jgi:hypothetical protein